MKILTFAFLSRYHTTSDLISEALAYMQETGADSRATAEWFLERHDELLQEWLPNYQESASEDVDLNNDLWSRQSDTDDFRSRWIWISCVSLSVLCFV